MQEQFIKDKTAYLYKNTDDGKRHMSLIFGDRVTTCGNVINGRLKADFRGRKGYIAKKELGKEAALEIYFIDVGQGDSTFIVTPGRKKILIDGGENYRALGFLAWKYRLDQDSEVDIDLLVLSHGDKDHLKGLIPIIKHNKIHVKKIIHSGIAILQDGAYDTELGNLNDTEEFLLTRHDSLADLGTLSRSDDFEGWYQAAKQENVPFSAVDASTGTIGMGEPAVKLEILGPLLDQYQNKPVYRWFSDPGNTINGHSVVLRLDYGEISVLFTGDLNPKGSKHLLADQNIADKLDAHVFKAPHHGSHKFHRPLLEAIRPQISVISSGDERDFGHPRAIFLGTVGLASRSAKPLIFSTEIAATFEENAGISPEEDNVEEDPNLEELNYDTDEGNAKARIAFKRRLHGMINVRTDGKKLFAARRISKPYWWESYGPLTPAP